MIWRPAQYITWYLIIIFIPLMTLETEKDVNYLQLFHMDQHHDNYETKDYDKNYLNLLNITIAVR